MSLHVGNLELLYAEGTPDPYYYGHQYFNAPQDWTAGTEISLALTVPSVAPPAPTLQAVTVSGSELYMTFDRYMDTASKPVPGDFHVTVNGARRNVADNGVSIAGLQVTLTLASVVSAGDTVKVRYTKPNQNPLRSFDRIVVETFVDQDVNNLTSANPPSDSSLATQNEVTVVSSQPTPEPVTDPPSDFSLATKSEVPVVSAEPTPTPEPVQAAAPSVTGVNVSSSPASGDTYKLGEVISVALTFSGNVDVDTSGGTPSLNIDMSPLAWGTKAASYASGTGTTTPDLHPHGGRTELLHAGHRGARGFARAERRHHHVVGIAGGRRTVPRSNWTTTPTIRWTGSSRRRAPTVTDVNVSSSPASGDTYKLGETISVTLTFSEKVDVTGTPRLSIDMGARLALGDEARRATPAVPAQRASPSATQWLSPTTPRRASQCLATRSALNGGTIRSSATNANADLSHTNRNHDANHKVNWQLSD